MFEYKGTTFKEGNEVTLITDGGYPLVGIIYIRDSAIYVAHADSAKVGSTGRDMPAGYGFSWLIGNLSNGINANECTGLTLLRSTKKPRVKRIKESSLARTASQKEALAQAIAYIKSKGFTHIKLELEGSAGRDEEDLDYYIREDIPSAINACAYFNVAIDGSVGGYGTEVQATIPIDNPEIAIKIMQSMNDSNGGVADNDGAGFHIGLLNSGGTYPRGNHLSGLKLANFKKAMTPLLPALYFLASCDSSSRELGYRYPAIESMHGAAINTEHGVLEYRIFETCYQKPEAFYDYICTIANTLQFYDDRLVLPKFAGKIGELGMPDDGDRVGRFYFSYSHYQALRQGLEILRPTYKSIPTLYRERGFKAQARKLAAKDKARELEWQAEFDKVKAEAKAKRAQALKDTNKTSFKGEVEHLIERIGSNDRYAQSNYGFYVGIKGLLAKQGVEAVGKELAKVGINEYQDFNEWRKRKLSTVPTAPRSPKKYVADKKRDYLRGRSSYGHSRTITV